MFTFSGKFAVCIARTFLFLACSFLRKNNLSKSLAYHNSFDWSNLKISLKVNQQQLFHQPTTHQLTHQPTNQSTDRPPDQPTDRPTSRPTDQPTNQPTNQHSAVLESQEFLIPLQCCAHYREDQTNFFTFV